MAIRRDPDDPGAPPPAEVFACALRVVGGRRAAPGAEEETEFPAIDLYETAEEFIVEAELPGVDPARIEVTASEGAILIEGAKEEGPEAGRVNFLCMERAFGPFRRVVAIRRAVNFAAARATCRAGLLQIRVPKVEEKRGRRRTIPVTAEAPGQEGKP